MTYSSTHPFEKSADGDWCGAPDFADRGASACARESDHPIHAIDRPEIDALAVALVRNQWRADGPYSEHRRHNFHHACAICTGDAHAIAAFVLDHLNGDRL